MKAVGKVVFLAHVVDRLANRPERRHRDELGLHAAAGRFLGIFERPAQQDAVVERQAVENLFLIRLLHVLENVDGIVGIEVLNGLGNRRVGQRPNACA